MWRFQRLLRVLRWLTPKTVEAKARALFIAAIIVIMTLALLWPWFRMESLADEQNLRVVREAARLELLRLHQGPGQGKRMPDPAAEPADRYRVETLGAGA